MASLISNISSNLSSPNAFETEFRRYLKSLIYHLSFVQAFIVLFGVLGNILVLVVMNRRSLKNTSSSVYITCMAILDSCVLLLHGANLARSSQNPFIHCSLTYLTDLAIFCANWVLVIITLERCVAVYSPFVAKRLCTVNSARYSICIFLTISTIIFSIKFPFIYDIKQASKYKKCLVHSNSGLILRIYQPILFYAIPDLLLLSNLFTVYALFRRTQRLSSACLKDEEKLDMRINDINSNRKQRQLTIMLVTVSFSFYLFTTPAMIMFISEYQPVQHNDINKTKRNFFISQMSVILLELNNATNFIFYCLAGQRFRQATRQTFYEYSENLKIFYHRYILCNKEYNPAPMYQHRLGYIGQTTITPRSSYFPCNPQSPYRTSTI
ncbi:unnamed protein product [Rotaria sp. Silwood2]|nr:unnamed protein product [Rotaria sp. Silwood2]CAF2503046.1 unnamed protein product [Rotaria sp. Silwood2]CAF2733673.1 unnamed protein product [Rotaria sp. Silwood2]CAF4153000.1 unnamed protein product [Rotaria sp. Silwood2]CAF4269374.1 unnamed protein product [Rotaria sp. Silwood2]